MPTLVEARPTPIPVKLPNLLTVPAGWRGVTVRLSGLLASGLSNPKLAKAETGSSGLYKVWGLSLAPAFESGYNLCPGSTPGCREHCLFFQGHAGVFPSVAAYRIARAVAFKERKAWFEQALRWELARVRRRADRVGATAAVRLNVMSDVAWERVTPWVFEEFPDVVFWDYTKLPGRLGKTPPNYHLTLSRSETNWPKCKAALRRGFNVAVVFHGEVPASYEGFPVMGGDESDLRFLDPSGHIVGLTAKGTARSDSSGFVAGRRSLAVV